MITSFERRFAARRAELEWLYMELYDDRARLEELEDGMRAFWRARSDALRRLDAKREKQPDWYCAGSMLGLDLLNDKIERLSLTYTYARNFLYLGRGYSYPVALEGALKLKEISYIHAEGYPAAEMKHGPIALIDQEMPSVIIAPKGHVYEKIVSNVQQVKARGGNILAIVTEGDTEISKIADHVLEVPEMPECLTPIITSVPLQLLSYYIAINKGKDVDMPRNLAKSVTVE